RRSAKHVSDRGLDLTTELRQHVSVRLTRLSQHHQTLRASHWIRAPKHSHTPPTQARDITNGLFQFIQRNVAPSPDDDAFRTASQIQRTPNHIRHVPRVQPGAMEETARGFRIMEITAGRRGPLKLQASLLALADFMASGIDNADLIARQGLSTGHEM